MNKSDEWMNNIYNIVKDDEKTYGTFAGLNNWSHRFTDNQLDAFNALIALGFTGSGSIPALVIE